MSLSSIFGKYVLFFVSLGTSVGAPLIYSSEGGGNKRITSTSVDLPRSNTVDLAIEKNSLQTLVSTSESGEKISVDKVVKILQEVTAHKTSVTLKKENRREISAQDIPKTSGEESKQLEKEELDEFLIPLLKTLEIPLYYRGYMNFMNKVRMTLPKDVIEMPTKYWVNESNKDNLVQLGFYLNSEKEYPKVMKYIQVQERDKFKELAFQAKKWFRDWNKGKNDNSEEYYDFYYEVKKGGSNTEIIFWKYFKDKWYSFEIEYSFDTTYSGPVLQVGYVYYKDTNWWGGDYYQAEGGRGYQRHIGAVGSSYFGNSEAVINKDFVSSFESADLSKFSKWWKILSECSKDIYCSKTLEVPKNASDYVTLPSNYYSEQVRDKWYENYHPFQHKFKTVGDSYKFQVSKLKNINIVREVRS